MPIDPVVVEQLALVFQGTPGFPCACGIRGDSLQFSLANDTFRTLLRLIAAVSTPGTVVVSTTPELNGAGPAPVELGTASGYDVLAGSDITNTGNSVLQDDLGLSPGTSVTGFPPGIVLGTQHITDTEAAQAQLDLTVAYLDAAGRTLDAVTVAGDLAGQTLSPGLYKSATSLANTGVLTLDAGGDVNATWIFQMGSTWNSGVGSSIVLAGGAQAANVTWQVGSSATIDVGATFKGTILALTSITANTGADIEGRLLARNGAVTLDDNAIVIPVNTAPSAGPLPTLTEASRFQLSALIDYLQGAPTVPLDARVVEELRRLFCGVAGFTAGCGPRGPSLADSLRDTPVRTLLQLLVAVSDATPGA